MNLSNRRAVLALALVVIASGCTDTTGGGASGDTSISQESGLAIESLEAFPSEAPERTPVQLEITLTNNGGVDATDVDWSIENIPLEGNRNWLLQSDLRQDMEIPAADPETGTAAGSITTGPALRSPNLDQGDSIDYNIRTEVEYDYRTSGTTEITLMSREEQRSSGSAAADVNLDNTGAPIQLSTNTRNPIVYYSSDSGVSVRDSRFCVSAEDVGAGEVVDGLITLEVQTSGNLEVGTTADSAAGPSASATTSIAQTRSSARECFQLSAPSSSEFSGRQTLPVTVDAYYRYRISDSTTVTVNGRSGGEDNANSDLGGSEDDSLVYVWSSETPDSIRDNEDPESYCTDASQPEELKDQYCEQQ